MECPHCGKRALSVATRCPHCDAHFPPRPLQRPGQATPLSRKLPGIVAALVVVAAALAAGVYVSRASKMSKSVGASTKERDSVAAPAAAPAPQPHRDSVRPAAPRQPVNTGLRYARTWTNVRGEPAQSAPIVGRLDPGESVQVDSLVRGWYRVLVEGRALGYVHRSTLAATPP